MTKEDRIPFFRNTRGPSRNLPSQSSKGVATDTATPRNLIPVNEQNVLPKHRDHPIKIVMINVPAYAIAIVYFAYYQSCNLGGDHVEICSWRGPCILRLGSSMITGNTVHMDMPKDGSHVNNQIGYDSRSILN